MDNENATTSYAGTAFNEHGVTNYSLHYRLYIHNGNVTHSINNLRYIIKYKNVT